MRIQGYSHSASGGRVTHDRFIVIDNKDVYKLGTSLNSIGMSQSSIDKVNDPEIGERYKDTFESWWSKAMEYKILV